MHKRQCSSSRIHYMNKSGKFKLKCKFNGTHVWYNYRQHQAKLDLPRDVHKNFKCSVPMLKHKYKSKVHETNITEK